MPSHAMLPDPLSRNCSPSFPLPSQQKVQQEHESICPHLDPLLSDLAHQRDPAARLRGRLHANVASDTKDWYQDPRVRLLPRTPSRSHISSEQRLASRVRNGPPALAEGENGARRLAGGLGWQHHEAASLPFAWQRAVRLWRLGCLGLEG